MANFFKFNMLHFKGNGYTKVNGYTKCKSHGVFPIRGLGAVQRFDHFFLKLHVCTFKKMNL